ncbi:MAG: hypothetical protein FWE05_07280 [Defluviitaleaceae bacterium]|nr:hypothetical protein [Defluviitaleaceae bacterium]
MKKLVLLIFILIFAFSAQTIVFANEMPLPTAPPAPALFAPNRPIEYEENGGFPVWGIILIAVGGVAVLGGAGYVGFIFFKKRKKKNEAE